MSKRQANLPDEPKLKVGRPKGFDKERARQALREKVWERMDAMIEAQVSHACGLRFLMVREKSSGKFLRVGKGAAEKLKPEEEIIEVWEKDPSVQAFTDLLNRTIDKPADTVEQTVKGGLVITWKTTE